MALGFKPKSIELQSLSFSQQRLPMGSFLKTRTEGARMQELGSSVSQQQLRKGRDGPSSAAMHPPFPAPVCLHMGHRPG